MTAAEVHAKVEAILADPDAEFSHEADDDLRAAFLRWLGEADLARASVRAEARAIAAELLRTADMERWYA